MDSPPIEGDVRIRVPFTYQDETGTEQNGWLPVYILADCPSSQCSRTGIHRAVFSNLAELCYHHPDLRAHMNHSTFILPARPAPSRPGGLQMMAEIPETSRMMEASGMASSPIGFFCDPNVTRVEERPSSGDISPTSSLNSKRTSNLMQTIPQGYVSHAFPSSPSLDDSDDDEPPLDLYLEPGYHTQIPRPQSPALGDVDVESLQTISSEQSTPSESNQIESRARNRLSSRASRQTMKEALQKHNQLDDPEVEDPVPTRYQRPDFNLDASGLVFRNELDEYYPIPEHVLATRAVRKILSSLTSSSNTSPSPKTTTGNVLAEPSRKPSASPQQEQTLSKSTTPAPDTLSNTSTSTPSPTSPPPPYSTSLSGSWQMVDVPRHNARLTVATTSSLSSPTPHEVHFTTCSCELLGGGDWHATWCERWEVVEGGG